MKKEIKDRIKEAFKEGQSQITISTKDFETAFRGELQKNPVYVLEDLIHAFAQDNLCVFRYSTDGRHVTFMPKS